MPVLVSRNELSGAPKCTRVCSIPIAIPMLGAIVGLGASRRMRHRRPASKSGNANAPVITRFAEKTSWRPTSSRKIRPRWLAEVVPLVSWAITASSIGNDATISSLNACVGYAGIDRQSLTESGVTPAASQYARYGSFAAYWYSNTSIASPPNTVKSPSTPASMTHRTRCARSSLRVERSSILEDIGDGPFAKPVGADDSIPDDRSTHLERKTARRVNRRAALCEWGG